MAGRTPYNPSVAAVYNIKSFSLAPVGTIQECYIPMDVDGCFGPNNSPDEQLIYWCAGRRGARGRPWGGRWAWRGLAAPAIASHRPARRARRPTRLTPPHATAAPASPPLAQPLHLQGLPQEPLAEEGVHLPRYRPRPAGQHLPQPGAGDEAGDVHVVRRHLPREAGAASGGGGGAAAATHAAAPLSVPQRCPLTPGARAPPTPCPFSPDHGPGQRDRLGGHRRPGRAHV
jgi:hypothetical protein